MRFQRHKSVPARTAVIVIVAALTFGSALVTAPRTAFAAGPPRLWIAARGG